jgi:hypothetical protein
MVAPGKARKRLRTLLEPEGGARSPAEDELVLVAILNRPRDLEIARTLGWYRIPLGTAPRTVRADWVAFYLPGAFQGERWSVRYLAEVRGIELTTRRELLYLEADHPRAAHPYYKVQLGPLLELVPPIPSLRWRRFSFLYTTGERLYSARDLTELTVPPSRARARLWRMLRERAGIAAAWI